MQDVIRHIIGNVKFSLFSPDMIRNMSALKITEPDTYNDDGYPLDGGLVDPRLGVIDPGLKCKTCGGKAKECPGHFGHIELIRPIIHSEFSKIIEYLLKTTCSNCFKSLILEYEAKEINEKGMDVEDEMRAKKRHILKKTKCPHCEKPILEIKYIKPTSFSILVKREDDSGTKRTYVKNLLPTDIRDWLASIPDESLRLLSIDSDYARPEWMVLTVLPVPPVNVRPSITLDSGERSEDDLTHKIVDIMRTNQRLEANINAGAPQLIIEDLWELLQYHITTYFNNETANIPPARHRSGRPLKTLSQRLKGKEGRFRYNLSGKRINFSARTVVSPDPNISIGEVGVPLQIAKEMTVQFMVTSWNIEEAKELIKRKEYPNAEYLVLKDGRRIKCSDTENIEEYLEMISSGCMIERKLQNNDITIFNRQPSLHRISMLGHRVKVLPGKTFRLNPVVCPPYNADFDGDEMNLHVLQTIESQVEVDKLMSVEKQIISPRHGNVIIKPQEDFVTGIYFLSNKENVFTKKQACNLLAIAKIYELPTPDVGKDKYSGPNLLSMIFPKELDYENPKGRIGQKVSVKEGKLIEGPLDNKTFDEILEKLYFLKGAEWTKYFIDSIIRIGMQILTQHGFSVSLKSYTPSNSANQKIKEISNKGIREIEGFIAKAKNKTLERQPGLTLRETLEEHIMKITSRLSKETGQILEKDLSLSNTSIVMAKIGARGSLLNVIQMCGIVGQQAVRNKRLTRGYSKRTLLQYTKGDLSAIPHGFIPNNFVNGLRPEEFFLTSMGGRESLVNTAIRTARSGYMQRRLVNALQDIVVKEDYSVRDSREIIVQFKYGIDCLDPMNNKLLKYFR